MSARDMKNQTEKEKKSKRRPILSSRLGNGNMLETILKRGNTFLCLFQNESWILEQEHDAGNVTLVPYAASNNLLRHNVVLLPGEPKEYHSKGKLIGALKAFIHRYVDLSSEFEEIAAHYVLLSWIYDTFKELPYLRFKGDYGSGKTRALLTIGSVCYKPIFASGASTVSPLFRMIDAIQGTLLIDEADFRFSDEQAEIIKILNNGNARGFPILRSEVNQRGEFNPRAFEVYGPKIVASRKAFDDQALESRCITEELGTRRLRKDIPINVPDSLEQEAEKLRSQLLLFRFRNRSNKIDSAALKEFEPRLQQVFNPLYSIMEDATSRRTLISFLRKRQDRLSFDRFAGVEAQVLEIIFELSKRSEQIGIKELTNRFSERFPDMYGATITPRWIGHIVRNSLSLDTKKSGGRYVIPRSQLPKMQWLFDKYRLS